MDHLTSTITIVLSLSLAITATVTAIAGTWKTITIITSPIATWVAQFHLFGEDDKENLESARAGAGVLGLLVCLFTVSLECNLLGRSYSPLYVKFENVHVTVGANVGIAVGKGLVEGFLTLGVLSGVVKVLGLGNRGREGTGIVGGKKA